MPRSARAASNRAVWRVRLVAFRVFRRVRAPKRASNSGDKWSVSDDDDECVRLSE